MAKEKIAKTNAARLLDKDKIAYELVPYEVDENDLSCVHVAASWERISSRYLRRWSCTATSPVILSVSYRANMKWI